MKISYLLILLSLTLGTPSQIDVSEVRTAYIKASGDEQAVEQLNSKLISVTTTDVKVLVAYKGAVGTMMAKYAKGLKDKKSLFKEGVSLLDYAVTSDSLNVEIRCIRLSVQENAPKITGYKKNIDDDKAFILKNYNSMTDEGAKKFVKGYALRSKVFNDNERQLFQGL
ncbi:hypothetical protein [Pareuzebyella sediminis]|uniref:hypothetical protein n=1 Tax=Pareuzebyella sediminis TaxID=2607998 RepID=UPI0011EE22EB|nr:hypothetical protein [Pareuzebyella sediminis]